MALCPLAMQGSWVTESEHKDWAISGRLLVLSASAVLPHCDTGHCLKVPRVEKGQRKTCSGTQGEPKWTKEESTWYPQSQ